MGIPKSEKVHDGRVLSELAAQIARFARDV